MSLNPFDNASQQAQKATTESSVVLAEVEAVSDDDSMVAVSNVGKDSKYPVRLPAENDVPPVGSSVLVNTGSGGQPFVQQTMSVPEGEKLGSGTTSSGGITEVFSGDYTRPNTDTFNIETQTGNSIFTPFTIKHTTDGDDMWFLENVDGDIRMIKFDTINETFFTSSIGPSSILFSTIKAGYENGVIYVFVDSNDNVVEYDISADTWSTNTATAPFSDNDIQSSGNVTIQSGTAHIITTPRNYYTYDISSDSFTTVISSASSSIDDEKVVYRRNGNTYSIEHDYSGAETVIYVESSGSWVSDTTLPTLGGDWSAFVPFSYDGSDTIFGYCWLASHDRLTAICSYSIPDNSLTIESITAVPKGGNSFNSGEGGIMGFQNSNGSVVTGPAQSGATGNIFEKTATGFNLDDNTVFSPTKFEAVQTYRDSSTTVLDGADFTAFVVEDFQNGLVSKNQEASFSSSLVADGSSILYGAEATNIKLFRYD